MANPASLKPFTKNDLRRINKPKGATSFKTDFRIACKEVAESLKLGEDPDAVQIEIIKRGIVEGLKGNFPFWNEMIKMIYGEIPSGVSPASDKTIIFKIVKDDKGDQLNGKKLS